VAEVIDFMPIDHPAVVTDRHHLVRAVRGIRGQVDMEALVQPRPDYGRAPAKARVNGTTAVFDGARPGLSLTSTWPMEQDDDDVIARFTVRAGEFGAFVLQTGNAQPQPIDVDGLEDSFRSTAAFWQNWLKRGTYRGRWRESVERSAITLKLMTYAPTGAMVAAPTTGLPEQAGGERNWDYRYTWIRDASFSVLALLDLGFTEEAAGLSLWIRDRVEERAGQDGPPLSIMYRVDGSSDLKEESLDHFEGYQGSRPVRIGNGASDQLQLDIYGEAMLSVEALDEIAPVLGHRGWSVLTELLNWICDNWNQPDEGIWETRGGRQNFVYGRLMCWTALDSAIRLAVKRSRPADVARWTAARDDLYRAIHERGWNPDLQAFVQYEGGSVLDASNLLMPVTGFIVPSDARWTSTLSAMDKTLVSDSLVYRHRLPRRTHRLRGDLLAVHILLRRCTHKNRSRAGRAANVREDADVREPRRAVLRGDRFERRTTRQLPAGVHASGPDPGCGGPGRGPRRETQGPDSGGFSPRHVR
jgi:GH15 family glucan-1,4-alpha-glucosidase